MIRGIWLSEYVNRIVACSKSVTCTRPSWPPSWVAALFLTTVRAPFSQVAPLSISTPSSPNRRSGSWTSRGWTWWSSANYRSSSSCWARYAGSHRNGSSYALSHPTPTRERLWEFGACRLFIDKERCRRNQTDFDRYIGVDDHDDDHDHGDGDGDGDDGDGDDGDGDGDSPVLLTSSYMCSSDENKPKTEFGHDTKNFAANPYVLADELSDGASLRGQMDNFGVFGIGASAGDGWAASLASLCSAGTPFMKVVHTSASDCYKRESVEDVVWFGCARGWGNPRRLRQLTGHIQEAAADPRLVSRPDSEPGPALHRELNRQRGDANEHVECCHYNVCVYMICYYWACFHRVCYFMAILHAVLSQGFLWSVLVRALLSQGALRHGALLHGVLLQPVLLHGVLLQPVLLHGVLFHGVVVTWCAITWCAITWCAIIGCAITWRAMLGFTS